VLPGDERIIAAPLDFLGVNYYRPGLIGARRGPAGTWTVWPGDERVEVVAQDAPSTAMGWPIDASGLTELLVRLHDEYALPIVVTENGAAFDDVLEADGSVHDGERVDYLEQHLRAAHDALERGVDLRGYFVWSLLDNFEWAEGYARRFGLVYVDYATRRRIPKDSARWYHDVIVANGLAERA
jgi:beta-glucosidase